MPMSSATVFLGEKNEYIATTTRTKESLGEVCADWGFRSSALPVEISVGSALLTARTTWGYERAAVAALLAIPERYIAALEEERLADLPGFIYEQHFIRRYASAFGIDSAPLLQTWRKFREEAEAPIAKQFVARVRWRDLLSSPMMWRRGAATIALLSAGLFVGYRLYGMVRPPALVLSSPTANEVTTNLSVIVAGGVDEGAQVTINDQPVGLHQDGSFIVPMSLQWGANTIRVVATKRFGQPATIERQIFATPVTPQTNNLSLDANLRLQ